MQQNGTAILSTAANIHLMLCEAAADQWGATLDRVRPSGGVVLGPGGGCRSYGTLASSLSLQVAARPNAFHQAAVFRTVASPIGHSLARSVVPAKLSGGNAYVQDLRLPGMPGIPQASVVRGPCDGNCPGPGDLDAVPSLPASAGPCRKTTSRP